MKQHLLPESYWALLLLLVIIGCSKAPFIEPSIGDDTAEPSRVLPDTVEQRKTPVAPPPLPPEPEPQPAPAMKEAGDGLDFSLAFADTSETDAPAEIARAEKPEPSRPSRPVKIGAQGLAVPSTMARIALKRNVERAVLYSLGNVDIKTSGLEKRRNCRGRIAVEPSRLVANEAILRATAIGRLRVALPCTLLARSSSNFFEYEEVSYRGSIIISAGSGKTITVINLLDVEDYLRGVVPLEIGKRGKEDIEAVKAQAVAARTYTYRRILERKTASYDLLPDVSDQVYGGVNAEQAVCDQAVRQTENIIMEYKDEVILAYYHSTCGGRTANVEDVWDKPPQPYLTSRSDMNSDGKAYCAISRYYQWNESWDKKALSSIVRRYGRKAYPTKPVAHGTITGIKVVHRYECGRIGACVIVTTEGTFRYGGDKIRFLLRRNIKNHPILRSARFEVASSSGAGIGLDGHGYGHGVGMCQMGAIGRARAGQNYEQILKAYYSGIGLRKVEGRGARGEGRPN